MHLCARPTTRIRAVVPTCTTGRGPSGRCASQARHPRTAVSRPSSVRWILMGEASTTWIGCDFTTGERGVGTAIACQRQRPCACLWHCLPLPEVECTLRISTITQCDLIAIGRCFLVSHDSEPSTKSAPHSIRRLSDLEIKAFAKRMKVPAWLCRGGRRGSSSTAR